MKHGTKSAYNNKCRCDSCKAANAAYLAAYRSTPQYREWRRVQVKRWRAARKAAS